MKKIIVIDENSNIKNELPEEYKDIQVSFSRYYKFEFYYENDNITVIANGYTGDYIYDAELLAEETVETIFNEIDWGEFVILDKRFDENNRGESDEK
nr:MAG TPA: hypothetical protein [Caudoviricetes sp.]